MGKLWTLLAAVFFLAALAVTPAGAETHTGNLHDCEDFGSQLDAQQHLLENPTDPDNLDADDDGTACEEFSYGGGGSTGGGSQSGGSDDQSLHISGGTWGPSIFDGLGDPPDAHGSYSSPWATTTVLDHDCSDFPSQAGAQSYLGAGLPDSAALDADNDGLACEDYFPAVAPPSHIHVPEPVAAEEHTTRPSPPTPPIAFKITPPSTGDAGLADHSP